MHFDLRSKLTALASLAFCAGMALIAPRTADAQLFVFVDKDAGGNYAYTGGNSNYWGVSKEAQCVPPRAGQYAKGTWNDCASSLWNYTQCHLIIYKDADYKGASRLIQPGEYVPNLKDIGFNDAISSHRFTDCN